MCGRGRRGQRDGVGKHVVNGVCMREREKGGGTGGEGGGESEQVWCA